MNVGIQANKVELPLEGLALQPQSKEIVDLNIRSGVQLEEVLMNVIQLSKEEETP